MDQVQINGLIVEKIAGSGPKILFVHGSNGGSWYWENFMNKFHALGYECYANNLRGHAPNPDLPKLGETSIFDYIDDVRGVVKELKPDIIIGHSMGGLIAQKIAEEFPFKAALFLCSANPKGVRFRICHPVRFIYYAIKQIGAVKNKQPLKMIYKMARLFALNNFTEDEAQKIFEKFVPESSTVAGEVGKGMVVVDPAKIKFPLLVVGAKNDMTAHWKMERAIAKFYKTDFILLEGHGHMFMIEKGWEETAATINTWLKQKGI